MKKEFYKTIEEITEWLNKYDIFYDYEIIPNEKYGFVVNLDTDFHAFDKNLTWIPIKFNIVNGVFNCSKNKLASLEFAPNYVGKSFYCNDNNLTSLEGCPKEVKDDFYCDNNQLKNLKGCPNTINFLRCDRTNLEDLSFFPEKIKTGKFIVVDKNTIEVCDFHDLQKIHNDYMLIKTTAKSNKIKFKV